MVVNCWPSKNYYNEKVCKANHIDPADGVGYRAVGSADCMQRYPHHHHNLQQRQTRWHHCNHTKQDHRVLRRLEEAVASWTPTCLRHPTSLAFGTRRYRWCSAYRFQRYLHWHAKSSPNQRTALFSLTYYIYLLAELKKCSLIKFFNKKSCTIRWFLVTL